MAWKKSPTALKEDFTTLMATIDGVEHRNMFGYACCFFQGNMFTGLHEDNWIIRLGEDDRQQLDALGGVPFAPMGTPMREYMMLPQDILKHIEALSHWIHRSIQFVSTLPPKVLKRRKAPKK